MRVARDLLLRYTLGMPTELLTADELLRLPDKHAELVRGVLIVREPPGLSHGRMP